ncbi:MAG TPA: response regulator transcription factor [Burkholderiales bacterium]|nr:response regulator transcription factor [Burkholderiales bacterium]
MSIHATQPIRVLLVDDHRCVLWGLAKLIESARPQLELVDIATCHREALAAMQKHRPHVVLLDLDLGGESGFDLVPQLASEAAVLILTGLRDPAVQERAVVAGARGVIYKTEPAELILKAIERVHAGEPWLDRSAMGRVLQTLSRRQGRPSEPPPHATLTAAERKVVAAVVRQRSAPNKVIADALHLSEHTLRNHLSSIYGKLGINKRVELVLHAMEHRLAQPSADLVQDGAAREGRGAVTGQLGDASHAQFQPLGVRPTS